MNGNKRYIGFAIFLVVALCAMVWAYGFVTNRQQSPDGVSIGVVRIDDVLEFNPSYEDYKQAKMNWTFYNVSMNLNNKL